MATPTVFEKAHGMVTAVRLASTVGMSREDWLKLRPLGIGGSEIAAVCGVSPWETNIDVYLEKIGMGEDREETDPMFWGKMLEDAIADGFAEKQNIPSGDILRVNAVLQHKDHPFALANLDRIVRIDGEWCVLEIKNVGFYSKDEWEGDEIPAHYALQVQWYMFVTGLRKAIFAALVEGRRLVVKTYERDDEMIGMMLGIATEFWACVQKRTPPQPLGTTDAGAALARLYPQYEAKEEVDADTKIADVMARRKATDDEIKRLQDIRTGYDNIIKDALKGNYRLVSASGLKVSWSRYEQGGIDVTRLREEMPEIAAKYEKKTPVQKLTWSGAKK